MQRNFTIDSELYQEVPRWPLYVHCASSVFMMSCSFIYHLFTCQSHEHQIFYRKFDYAGISIMIAGNSTPMIYYGFMCPQTTFYRNLYLGAIWIIAIIALVLVFSPNSHNLKWLKVVVFLFAGWSTVPAIWHLNNPSSDERAYISNQIAWPWIGGGLLYSVGAICYAVKFPEVICKKRFDLIGSSH